MKQLSAALLLVAIAATSGCGRSFQARDVEFSGFLDDYDRLESTDGKDYQALYRWADPDVDWSRFERILLDPVLVYGDAEQRDMSAEDRQELVNYLYQRVYAELAQDYKMVGQPSPDTLRIQFALTTIDASVPVLDGASTVVPIGLGVSAVTFGLTGQSTFTGQAALEFRARDAMTQETIAEGVDRRVGGRDLGKGMSEWADVKAAMDTWAQMLRYRLCQLRGERDCPKPR